MTWACAIFGFFLAICLVDQSVVITWDANTEHDLAGYTIYCGDKPKIYNIQLQVARVTEHATPPLTPGIHYCAITARNIAGRESEFSNEILVVIPK